MSMSTLVIVGGSFLTGACFGLVVISVIAGAKIINLHAELEEARKQISKRDRDVESK